MSADKFQQEPEKIKKWREEQKARLTQKDAEEEQKKKELKENAKKELEDWYKNRAEQLAKTHANNKLVQRAVHLLGVSRLFINLLFNPSNFQLSMIFSLSNNFAFKELPTSKSDQMFDVFSLVSFLLY